MSDDPAPPDQEPRRPADWRSRRRLAAVFGDVLPDTTSDEREAESGGSDDEAQERWLRGQVPPHHG